MAAMEKSNVSRTGSLSIDGNLDGTNSQTHLLHGQQNGHEDRSSLSALARRSTIRKRSLRFGPYLAYIALNLQSVIFIYHFHIVTGVKR